MMMRIVKMVMMTIMIITKVIIVYQVVCFL